MHHSSNSFNIKYVNILIIEKDCKSTHRQQKILIPVTLISVIIIAGVFAFYPVEKASTVHGTLESATSAQSNADDQERIFSFNVDNAAGATITNFVLVPDNNVDLVGSVSAVLSDEAAAGSSKIECTDGSGNALEISAALTTIDDEGTSLGPTALPSDCEAIRTTVPDGDNIIISIYINNWPEV